MFFVRCLVDADKHALVGLLNVYSEPTQTAKHAVEEGNGIQHRLPPAGPPKNDGQSNDDGRQGQCGQYRERPDHEQRKSEVDVPGLLLDLNA